MDEFTRKILADMEEQTRYPDRFRLLVTCKNCHSKHYISLPKTEVSEYVQKHGSNSVVIETCDKCNPDSNED